MSKKSSKIIVPRGKGVRFVLQAPDAQKVSLVGDFNRWDVNSLPMKRGTKGNWTARIDLEPGRYEYRFYVDGTWQDDPYVQERVENPFGGQNCVRIVI